MRTRRTVAIAVVVGGGVIWGGARLVPRASSQPQASQRVGTSSLLTIPYPSRVAPSTRPTYPPSPPVLSRPPMIVQSNQREHRRRAYLTTVRAADSARLGPTTVRPRETRPAGPPTAVGVSPALGAGVAPALATPTTPIAPATPAQAAASLPVGITIPRLGIQGAPVYDRGLDAARRLPIAPGYAVTHYQFSAPVGTRGNAVLYGHDDIEGSIFRSLPLLQPGDRILLRVGQHPAIYEVTGQQIVAPTDVAVMEPLTTATLTVISCYPYGIDSQRIVVRARLLSPLTQG